MSLLAARRSSDDRKNYRQRHPEAEDNDGGSAPPEGWHWYQLIPGLVLALLYYSTNTDPIPDVPFSFFLKHMVQLGLVEKLEVSSSRDKVYIYLYPDSIINGRMVRPYGPQFIMSISGVETFEKRMNSIQDEMNIIPEGRIPIRYKSTPETLNIFFNSLLTIAIIGGIYYYFIRGRIKIDGRFGLFDSMTKAKTTIVTNPSQIKTRMSDVAGMEEAKTEVMEFVDYLKDPWRFSDLGARIPKGALLHGPPGTGKTLLARAIASEAHVPFLSIAGPDFVEMFAGVGSARMRDLFKQARENAPCILYIDEVDAVGRSRQSNPSIDGNSEQENTLNQLLVEMDGINPLEGVVVLASTNRVDILDHALMRPGRFDRQIAIDLPTLPERKAIFNIYLKKILLDKPYHEYSSRLAALTPGHSGADIANIVNEGALHAARERNVNVTEKDFEYAVERVIAGMEKKNSSLSKEEREVIAYHEAGHAVVGWLLEHTDPILKVSIVPRTKGILGFSQQLPSDQKLYTTQQLFDRMCMILGGRAAEVIIFKKITTRAQDDLQKVTNMAYKQILEYGMNPVIGNISLPPVNPTEPSKRFYSNQLAKMVDKEVKELIGSAYGKADMILNDNMDKLHQLAQKLLQVEVLNNQDLREVLGEMPYNKDNYQHIEDV
jgi:spastic paraplegia protein 7